MKHFLIAGFLLMCGACNQPVVTTPTVVVQGTVEEIRVFPLSVKVNINGQVETIIVTREQWRNVRIGGNVTIQRDADGKFKVVGITS